MTAIAEVHAKDERLAKIAVNSILKKIDEDVTGLLSLVKEEKK